MSILGRATDNEHEFEDEFGPCVGCGKYVEQLIDERYCSMKKIDTKYPGADTSPERLAEIADIFHKIEPRMRDVMNNPDSIFPAMRDLLAMLQERAWLDTHELCHCQLSGEVHLNEKGKSCEICDDGRKVTPINIHNALAKYANQANELRQQLHDQRWRDNYSEDWPEGQDADTVQWSKDGRWWRPIPPLPTDGGV